jgi:cytochrome oxidase Cu insertion factor (SCO1/SenC/PrrC family)
MLLSTLLAASVLSTALLPAMELNRPAPEFTIELPNKSTVSLSQYKGKIVAVVFMSPTCPHCQQLTPTLVSLQNTLGPQGFQVISVAFSEMKDYMPEYMMKYQPNYPAGTATRQQNEAFLQHSTMMRFMVPQIVLIDKKGVIRQHFDSGHAIFRDPATALRAEVEKLLNEGKTPTPVSKKPAKSVKKAS